MLEPQTVERFTRQARALARSGTLDAEALMQLRTIRDAYDLALKDAIVSMRQDGYSWTVIGRGLDIPRQQAHRDHAAYVRTRLAQDASS